MEPDFRREGVQGIEELFNRHAQSLYETILDQTRRTMSQRVERRFTERRLDFDRRQRVELYDYPERRNSERRHETRRSEIYGTLRNLR